MTRRRRIRSLAQRNVPPTNWMPGMYGPGQEHRDGPLSPRERSIWNLVIGGVIVAGVLLFILTALFYRG